MNTMKLRDPETLNKVTLEHDNPPSGLPVVIEQTERTLFYQTKSKEIDGLKRSLSIRLFLSIIRV